MPNSPMSAFLYLILLIPGIVYVKTSERHRASLKLSAFRETTNVIFASVVSLFALAIPVILTAVVNDWFGALAREVLTNPARAFGQEPVLFVGSVLAAVVVSSLLAFIAGTSFVSSWVDRKLSKKTKIRNHWSAWISAFEVKEMQGKTRLVSLTLKDGSWLQGALYSYSAIPEDSSERAIVLYGYNRSCSADSDEVRDEDDQFFVVQADQIAKLTVVPYSEPQSDS